MIHHKGKSVGGVWYMGKPVSVIYHKAMVVWRAIRSCFGAGYWRGDKPWIGDEAWKG